jgi:voltage-gated potassium channel Kch
MLDTARRLNPAIETVARTHSDSEAELLRRERVDAVFMGEHELALGMIRHVLARLGRQPMTRFADMKLTVLHPLPDTVGSRASSSPLAG